MARITRREATALAGAAVIGCSVAVTAALGQTQASLALTGILLALLGAMILANHRAITTTRTRLDDTRHNITDAAQALQGVAATTAYGTALDDLSRSMASLNERLERTSGQVLADTESTLEGLRRELETVRFGQTMISQATGRIAADLEALVQRFEPAEGTIVSAMSAEGGPQRPDSQDDTPQR